LRVAPDASSAAAPAPGAPQPTGPRERPSLEVIEHFKPNDTFVVSTSEFVAPAIPISYVKAKGTFLLFRHPTIKATLVPEMNLWIKATIFTLRGEISFKGQIYRIFGEGEGTYPCIIIRTPQTLTVVPVKMDEGALDCELPMTWRKTAKMKRGTIKRLTLKGGIFESPEPVAANDKIFITIELGDYETDEMQIELKRLQDIVEGGQSIGTSVEFTLVNLNPVQETRLQKGMQSVKAKLAKEKEKKDQG
jgi:hypothetical protein